MPNSINIPFPLYDMRIKNNLIIFDVGAHKGQTSSHFIKLLLNSFIHALQKLLEDLVKLPILKALHDVDYAEFKNGMNRLTTTFQV